VGCGSFARVVGMVGGFWARGCRVCGCGWRIPALGVVAGAGRRLGVLAGCGGGKRSECVPGVGECFVADSGSEPQDDLSTSMHDACWEVDQFSS
jgi:hypothetical protein